MRSTPADTATARRVCTALARIRGGCPPDNADVDAELRRALFSLDRAQREQARALARGDTKAAQKLRERNGRLLMAIAAAKAGRWFDPSLMLETRRG